jgi:hypothetical protein
VQAADERAENVERLGPAVERTCQEAPVARTVTVSVVLDTWELATNSMRFLGTLVQQHCAHSRGGA